MEKRPTRKSRPHRRTNDPPEKPMTGLSLSVILCVFFLIIAHTGGSLPESMRKKTSELISRNVLEEFEDKGNIKDNLVSFVQCMLSTDKNEEPPAKPETDVPDDSNSSAAPEIPEPPPEDTPPE